jgi:intraflagellar transport protein 172
LLITHFLLLKSECARGGLTRVLAKLCTSLLRYTKEIRADKAFMDAGEANRREGINNMAFMFFNRYLDLYEAIEDPDSGGINDNSDFQDTDIPSPAEIPLPEKNLISVDERDNIRDWVLNMNMNAGVDKNLSMRNCENCGNEIYEAALHCHHCRCSWEPCIVSGFPLVRSQAISCKICSKGAVRDYWNDYISQLMKCPWCKSMQTPY